MTIAWSCALSASPRSPLTARTSVPARSATTSVSASARAATSIRSTPSRSIVTLPTVRATRARVPSGDTSNCSASSDPLKTSTSASCRPLTTSLPSPGSHTKVSAPASRLAVSSPRLPSTRSLPGPPTSRSAPAPPYSRSSPCWPSSVVGVVVVKTRLDSSIRTLSFPRRAFTRIRSNRERGIRKSALPLFPRSTSSLPGRFARTRSVIASFAELPRTVKIRRSTSTEDASATLVDAPRPVASSTTANAVRVGRCMGDSSRK